MPPPDTLISPTNSADSKPDAEANITLYVTLQSSTYSVSMPNCN